jgi:hypothetical protein
VSRGGPVTGVVKHAGTSVAYVLHGLHIDVSIEDPCLDSVANGLFGPFAGPDRSDVSPDDRVTCSLATAEILPALVPAGADVIHESVGLRVSGRGARLYIEVDGLSVSLADLAARRLQVWVARDQADSAWTIQHFAVLPLVMEFLRLRGLYPVHAAALELDGNAVILPAQPGSGKSTLSIALVRQGLRLLSDDMPFLSNTPGPEVLAFPEDVNVCADGSAFFDELDFLAERTPNERGKHSVALGDLFPDSVAERGVPRLLVFPRIARTVLSRLRPMSKQEALVALLDHSLPPLNRSLASPHFETMMDVVASCACYQLDTGLDPGEAARQLASLLIRSSTACPGSARYGEATGTRRNPDSGANPARGSGEPACRAEPLTPTGTKR